MTLTDEARPPTSTPAQWWVLTVRMIRPSLRNGEFLTQLAASIMFTVSFYLPLKQIMGPFIGGMSSYAQYLTPLIALNAVTFAALSAAFRSATDAVQGINRRFKAMPLTRLTPLASRMSASVYRCGLALVLSLICGHVIGFRFYGSVPDTVGFCLLLLLIGTMLSLLGDLIGAATENPDATVPLMLLPTITFGLMSVGLQPADRFPEWIQGFVRDQPVSRFIVAMRALAGDSTPAAGAATWAVLGPAVVWLVGLTALLLTLHRAVAARRR